MKNQIKNQPKSQSKNQSAKPDKQPRILKLESALNNDTRSTFFLIVNPGLEELAEQEAKALFQATDVILVRGGVQFTSTWGVVGEAQPKLKIATRLLVRVDQFGARDFPKLFRKIEGLSWTSWLKPGVGVHFRSASHGSRLRIKKRIDEVAEEGFAAHFKAAKKRVPTENDPHVTALVRIDDDLVTMSLDLSGELLHKRGDREDVGVAPLRETWAAAMVHVLAREMRSKGGDWEWIEPMAGTAVFLREALGEAQAAKRTFSFDTHFQIQPRGVSVTEKSAVQPGQRSIAELIQSAIVIDSDPEQLARARAALESHPGASHLALLFALDQNTLDQNVLKVPASPSQSLAQSLDQAPAVGRVVVVNPPWGRRLKGHDQGVVTDTPEGQLRLLAKLEENWQPGLVSVIMPRTKDRLVIPKGWVELPSLSFNVGGIPVAARFFKIPSRLRS